VGGCKARRGDRSAPSRRLAARREQGGVDGHLPPLPLYLRKGESEPLKNRPPRTVLGLDRHRQVAPDNPRVANDAALGIDGGGDEALDVAQIRLRRLPERGFPVHRERGGSRERDDLIMPKVGVGAGVAPVNRGYDLLKGRGKIIDVCHRVPLFLWSCQNAARVERGAGPLPAIPLCLAPQKPVSERAVAHALSRQAVPPCEPVATA